MTAALRLEVLTSRTGHQSMLSSINLAVAIVGFVAGCVTIVAGLISIRFYFKPRRDPKILNPQNGAENGGRYLVISGVVPRRRIRCQYWIAIQPSDCRGAGVWWPQHQPLTFHRSGSWIVPKGVLGRDGSLGEERDSGKTYTISLVEVPRAAQAAFHKAAAKGERLTMPLECNLLDSVEVRRMRRGA